MAKNPDVILQGDEKLLKELDRLRKKSEDIARQVVAKTALEIIKVAKQKVKIKTHRLQTSITGAMQGEQSLTGKAIFKGEMVTNIQPDADKNVAFVGTGVGYAKIQEFEKVGRPYLRPALADGNRFMRKSIKEGFKHLESKGIK